MDPHLSIFNSYAGGRTASGETESSKRDEQRRQLLEDNLTRALLVTLKEMSRWAPESIWAFLHWAMSGSPTWTTELGKGAQGGSLLFDLQGIEAGSPLIGNRTKVVSTFILGIVPEVDAHACDRPSLGGARPDGWIGVVDEFTIIIESKVVGGLDEAQIDRFWNVLTKVPPSKRTARMTQVTWFEIDCWFEAYLLEGLGQIEDAESRGAIRLLASGLRDYIATWELGPFRGVEARHLEATRWLAETEANPPWAGVTHQVGDAAFARQRQSDERERLRKLLNGLATGIVNQEWTTAQQDKNADFTALSVRRNVGEWGDKATLNLGIVVTPSYDHRAPGEPQIQATAYFLGKPIVQRLAKLQTKGILPAAPEGFELVPTLMWSAEGDGGKAWRPVRSMPQWDDTVCADVPTAFDWLKSREPTVPDRIRMHDVGDRTTKTVFQTSASMSIRRSWSLQMARELGQEEIGRQVEGALKKLEGWLASVPLGKPSR